MEIIKTAIDSFTYSISNFFSLSDKNIIILIVIFIVVAGIFNTPFVKGKLGEVSIKSKLKKLPVDTYKIFNDIMIKNSKGNTNQIDHIVVSKYGVFVIETKNYQGWITGNEKSEKWTQTIYKKKSHFYNPIRQNYGHIRALMEMLDLPQGKFILIVAFSTRADLKVNASSSYVVYFSKVLEIIRMYKEIILTDDQVNNIVESLQKNNIIESEQRRNHAKKIRSNVQKQETMIASGICPRCGGNLVLRTAKTGQNAGKQFYGCSNFPKCRYVNSSI